MYKEYFSSMGWVGFGYETGPMAMSGVQCYGNKKKSIRSMNSEHKIKKNISDSNCVSSQERGNDFYW